MKRLPAAWAATCLILGFVVTASSAASSDDESCLIPSQDERGTIAGWRSYHEDPKTQTADVWRLSDNTLVCRGRPRGYLYTEKDYTNFVLRLEWRWPPGGKAGNGGVLIRTTGEHKLWPKSLEAQLNAGDAGDFWGLDGYPLTGPAERPETLDNPTFGRLTHLKKQAAAEKPAGQWNRYEIIADGESVTLKINGVLVNRATGCPASAGKIVLTAEGDEIHFRAVKLTPIKK